MAEQGRTAIVTGGGSGIRRAICLLLAREGADVAVVDQNDEAAAAGRPRTAAYAAAKGAIISFT
jgi:NAD(P)-dependent dehydrogenase (short-subunit alcohol dehydrogenase family)